MRKNNIVYILICLTFFPWHLVAQGKNHNWLIGYDVGLFDTSVTSTKARLNFNNNQINVNPESFTMPFAGAQANISDESGKLIISTNGCWIADSTGNMMLNGDSLNPNSFTDDWCGSINGQPYPHSSVILPWPGDSSNYALFHLTGNYNADTRATELYMSTIDMNQNNGLGKVINKNSIVISDILSPCIAACKHANGRDWWIIAFKDSTDIIYELLLTPNGVTATNTQHLNLPIHYMLTGTPKFSPNGEKFAFHYRLFGPNGVPVTHLIRLLNFDRCSGQFTSPQTVQVVDSLSGNGLAFSSNSNYLYFSTYSKIFQARIDTSNIQASVDTVALFDGYCYPYNYLCTYFWTMYLAANSKIYVSSGSSVIDLNYINMPDSDGIACDVRQHALRVPCYTYRGNVNHPNYYLGPVIGSICDSLSVGQEEYYSQIQNFQISPNPLKDGPLQIMYLLPQNLSGLFEVYDLNGKIIYQQKLPPWSSMQSINLPNLRTGLYSCVIRSGGSVVSKKLLKM